MTEDIEPLFEEDVEDVEEAFNQLVEAWEDRLEADQALASYKATVGRPGPPSVFEGKEFLAEFVQKKNQYEQDLRQLTGNLEASQNRYHQATQRAGGLLPNGTSLKFDYQGDRVPLRGTRYVVRNQAPPDRHASISVEVQSRSSS